MSTYDVVVVGAGVEGSATAYYLTSRYTKNVLLLEQFGANHTKGSSGGGSRGFHCDYGTSQYIRLVNDSIPLWKELEGKSGTKIMWNCGAISFCKVNSPGLPSRIRCLRENAVLYELLTSEELKSRYPDQLKTPSDHQCIYFPEGGAINADLALKAMQQLFVQNGGDFRDYHKVTGVLPGPVIVVETDKGSFRSRKVVFATGAWTNKVLHSVGLGIEMPMKVYKTEVFYFQVFNSEIYKLERFPIFIESILDHNNPSAAYGIPTMEYPNMIKVCEFFGNGDDEIQVDDITKLVPSEKSLPNVQRFIQTHFKGVEIQPTICKTCVYANTPDFYPYIDKHPSHANIIIAAGFSSGFKMSPMFGKIIAEITLDIPSSYNLSDLTKTNRFEKQGLVESSAI